MKNSNTSIVPKFFFLADSLRAKPLARNTGQVKLDSYK
jgi:hypothetical protein